jgi:mannitol-1-phosphate/altronate dehydrogenase
MSNKNCVIFGAGALGLAFLGPELGGDYDLTYVDIPQKADLLGHMNSAGWYVFNETGPASRSERITGTRGIVVTEEQKVQTALATADLVFTAVGEPNLHKVAPTLAMAVSRRSEKDPLRVLCCENGLQIARKCRENIRKSLGADPGEALIVGDTVMGRMCKIVQPLQAHIEPVVPDADWAVCGEPFFGLPVRRAVMAGLDRPGEAFQVMSREEFSAQEDVKMLAHNGLHAFLSFLGTLKKAEYFCELTEDPLLMRMAARLLREESAPALLKKHGRALGRNFFYNYAPTILRRITCPGLHDPLSRGTRGGMRKLQPWERLVGSLRTVARQGIEPVMFATGIAAAILVGRRREETQMDFHSILTQHCDLDEESEAELIELCEKRRRWVADEVEPT